MSKWLIASDFHIPFNNKRLTSLFFDVQKWFDPDYIDILGDLDDACPVSRFADGTAAEVLDATYTYAPLVQSFWSDIRATSPDADVHFATGNHEQRYDDYVSKKAPALRGMITPELLWKTDTYGVNLSYYNNPPVERFPGFYVHHGPYAVNKAGESVRKVMDDFNISCMVGHSHRQAYVAKSYPLPEVYLRGWEIGHLTDINSSGMAYDRKHDWQPGFAIAHVENDYPHVQLVSVSPDYVCYVDGRKFSA
jgi:hypothetical protein